MSQLPRRTSEFQASSSKRPARSSRIPSSALRPSSNRISTAPTTSNARPSTTFSKVPQTPMRTPAKTPNKMTAGNKERMTMVQMTAEKEKPPIEDREYISMKSQQILEELSKQDRFKELVQKGLKSMTLKTFIAILEYFLEPILGALPKDFQTNYVDFLHNILLQFDYPYNINKSSLKTPNAPHCLNNIIILLGWLADFSKTDDDLVHFKIADHLPDLETINVFVEQTNEAYRLFNEEKEYNHVEKKICDTYMEMRAGSDVQSEIERLKYDMGQLKRESTPLSLQKDLSDKKAEAKALDDRIEAQNKKIGDFNRKITNLRASLGFKQQAHQSLQKELVALKHKISTQRMTVEQRQEMLIEITHLKSALMSKRNAVLELNEASSEKEILLSNLISKKFQLIDRLNNLLYKLSSDLNMAGMKDQFDTQMYEIKSTKDDTNLALMIENIRKGLEHLKEKFAKMQQEMQNQVIKVESDMLKCKSQNELHQVKYQQLQSTFQKIEEDEMLADEQLSNLMQNIQINYHERKEKIQQNENQIVERTKGIEELQIEIEELAQKRKAFGAKAVSECQKVYLEKKIEIESRRKYLQENIKAMDNYEQNREALPENLQTLLNEIIKEHDEKENRENLAP